MASMHETFKPYRIAAAYLSERLEEAGLAFPLLGIICGSGLSELSKTLDGKKLAIKYAEIPGFPAHCTVHGHKGEVVFGLMAGVPSVCFRGRFHSYEGHDVSRAILLPLFML